MAPDSHAKDRGRHPASAAHGNPLRLAAPPVLPRGATLGSTARPRLQTGVAFGCGPAAWLELAVLGVSERAVMDMMGWSNSAMVKRYAHVTARLRRDIADLLNSYFWGGK